jgi:sugar lactone lactonase YvrE
MSDHSQDNASRGAKSGTPGDWQVITHEPDLLGESPFWHPGEQMLYWVDIDGRQLRRARVEDKGHVESWPMPSEPGCIAPARSGGLVIALRDGSTVRPAGVPNWH